jgi:hypothetical protein
MLYVVCSVNVEGFGNLLGYMQLSYGRSIRGMLQDQPARETPSEVSDPSLSSPNDADRKWIMERARRWEFSWSIVELLESNHTAAEPWSTYK